MGGALGGVRTNNELVDYLRDAGHLRSKDVTLAFRVVDRANYIFFPYKANAYNNIAWKRGNFHLSAPGIYAVAMEFLCLKPGQSFLNIGSGTGYFSTVAGLLLGAYGINHGIELYEDCVQYARERLENFKKNSQALELFEFCEPSFVQGNCLRVIPTREYDAVYCGAGVSDNDLATIKQFVRIGGRIVVPYKDYLCRFKRLTTTKWQCKKLLGVLFTPLSVPEVSDKSYIDLPDSKPLSLQELCRIKVRQILRENVWMERPELKKDKRNPLIAAGRTIEDAQFLPYCLSDNPLFPDDDDDDDDDDDADNDDDNDDDDDDADNDDDDDDDDDDGDDNDDLILRTVRYKPNISERYTELVLAIRAKKRRFNDFSPETKSSRTLEQYTIPSLDQNNTQLSSNQGNPTNKLDTSDSDTDNESFAYCTRIPRRRNTDSGMVKDGSVSRVNTKSISTVNTVSDLDENSESDADTGVDSSIVTDTDTVQSPSFVVCMKKKILMLPLPTAMKIYISHNRKL